MVVDYMFININDGMNIGMFAVTVVIEVAIGSLRSDEG